VSTKIETLEQNVTERAMEVAGQAGFLLMAAAATIGMMELPDHFDRRVVTPGQPAYAVVQERGGDQNNPLRREREETGPHYISYSIAQRTPGRSGRS
jgi:hypothetical protein